MRRNPPPMIMKSNCGAWNCCIHPVDLRTHPASRRQSSEMGRTWVLENITELTNLQTSPTTRQLSLMFKLVESDFLLMWPKARSSSRDIHDNT